MNWLISRRRERRLVGTSIIIVPRVHFRMCLDMNWFINNFLQSKIVFLRFDLIR